MEDDEVNDPYVDLEENLLKRLAVLLVKLDQTYDQFPAFAPVFTRIEVLLLAKAIEFWAVENMNRAALSATQFKAIIDLLPIYTRLVDKLVLSVRTF